MIKLFVDSSLIINLALIGESASAPHLLASNFSTLWSTLVSLGGAFASALLSSKPSL